jgi:hypothetical protein
LLLHKKKFPYEKFREKFKKNLGVGSKENATLQDRGKFIIFSKNVSKLFWVEINKNLLSLPQSKFEEALKIFLKYLQVENQMQHMQRD